jgi:hypothetical protein
MSAPQSKTLLPQEKLHVYADVSLTYSYCYPLSEEENWDVEKG